MQYNCVYYCDTCYIHSPSQGLLRGVYVSIGVVSVHMQYNCVYYCDTWYMLHTTWVRAAQ
jgi:hypothetical protein